MRESFSWMRQRATGVPDDYLEALTTAVVINDLGKNPSLTVYYHLRRGEGVSALNHDAILLKACRQQGAVTENAPARLNVLRRFSESDYDRRAVALHFLEQQLDVSGAAGHMD
ncbi:hypothetical protein N657DRAFT_675496 [Parathielavia appendiculata]|uniref:Uncharacterized protein n=1 Tax=Parathielavia appendiculata TaxID=2587402 RepID=A0AAN6YZL0_9PEZI|nr:hypothetical protein N657DRAFT_675496 [Parathielavia appendiculata]